MVLTNKMVATTAPIIAAVMFLVIFLNSCLLLTSTSDSNDAPTTTQQTTTSAMEVGSVCAKTLDITTGFRETGPWMTNNTNPSNYDNNPESSINRLKT
jgi:hypothetical protein